MHIGDKIAVHRKRRGISQETLGGLLGLSRSWVSQVERGIRGVDRVSTLTSLAAVLQLDVTELIAVDRPPGVGRLTRGDLGNELRKELTDYRYLKSPGADSMSLPRLARAAGLANREYQLARYERTAKLLPKLLRVVDVSSGLAGRNSQELNAVRCQVYAVTAKLLTKIGEPQLAWLAADRAATAAYAAECPNSRALAAYQVSCALLAADQASAAENVAVDGAEILMSDINQEKPETASLAGALWLLASVIAARRADRQMAAERLKSAERLSRILIRDKNFGWTAFGPTNVRIHQASVAAELGDPTSVLRIASEIRLEALPMSLQGRRGRVSVDLAWAQAQARNGWEAILHLKQAERISGEIVAYDVTVRAILIDLLKKSKRPSAALADLARKANVL